MCSLPTSSSSGSRQFVLCCLLVCVSLVRQYLLLMYNVHCHFSRGMPKWMTIHDMYVVHTAKNLRIPKWPFKTCCEERVTPNRRSKVCLVQSQTSVWGIRWIHKHYWIPHAFPFLTVLLSHHRIRWAYYAEYQTWGATWVTESGWYWWGREWGTPPIC